MKKVSTEEFITKAHTKHGNKFDYSKVKYIKNSLKILIGCKIHGAFEQRPADHLRGDKCPTCKFEKIASQKRSNATEFAVKAHCVHNNEYDYSKVVYVNAITKIEIVCSKHGSFFQTPDKHLGGTACPKCSHGISRAEKQIQKVLEDRRIDYVFNKTFPGLHGKTKNAALRYDFWLPDYNLLVEYDGVKNNIQLLRIKYDQPVVTYFLQALEKLRPV